jgi:hypothetical protein
MDKLFKPDSNGEKEVREVSWFAQRNSLAELFFEDPPKEIIGGSSWKDDGEDKPKVFFGIGDNRNTYDPFAPRLVEREIMFTDPETGEHIWVEEQYIVRGEGIIEVPDDEIDHVNHIAEEKLIEEWVKKNFEETAKSTVNFVRFVKPNQ